MEEKGREREQRRGGEGCVTLDKNVFLRVDKNVSAERSRKMDGAGREETEGGEKSWRERE